LPAINSLDAAAKEHDLTYDQFHAAGAKGAFFTLEVLYADERLVKKAQAVIEMYKNNQKDPVNGQPIGLLQEKTAENVVKLFTAIIAEKKLQIKVNNFNGIDFINKKEYEAIQSLKDMSKKVIQTVKSAVTSPSTP
jgi:hypothetical protein